MLFLSTAETVYPTIDHNMITTIIAVAAILAPVLTTAINCVFTLINKCLDFLKYLLCRLGNLFCSFFLTRSMAQYVCRITWYLSATIVACGKHILATCRKCGFKSQTKYFTLLFELNCEKYFTRLFS